VFCIDLRVHENLTIRENHVQDVTPYINQKNQTWRRGWLIFSCIMVTALAGCASQEAAQNSPPQLLQTLNLATTTPEPKDFVLSSRREGSADYPNIGVTPSQRTRPALKAETLTEAEADLGRARSAAQKAARSRP
jgi:hypothetical protein